MKYFYLTAEGKTAGPETLETLTGMVARGEITLGTLVVPAGGEDWTPLARVLRYFYADQAGETAGPVAFSEINRLHQIAALRAEGWVMEEGGGGWRAAADVLTAAGVPVLAPPATATSAIPRTPTGAYRPPATRTVAVRYYATGGIGRMQYILFLVLLNGLFVGGMFAIGANAAFRAGEFSSAEFDALYNRSATALVLMLGIATVGGIVISILRQQNIGWPWYFVFLALIPLVNFWFGIALLAYPPGYARHKRFDAASKAIAGVVVALVIAGVVLMMIYGKHERAATGESRRQPSVRPA